MSKLLTVMLVGSAILVCGSALAETGATTPEATLTQEGWGSRGGATTLLIETTTSAVDAALIAAGEPFDSFFGSDFSAIDLSPYNHVFVAMDGGNVEDPSIVNVANWAAGGGCLHFYGGTALQPYVIALNAHLLQNQTNNYFWTTVAGVPHSTVVNGAHYLAQGLPANYTFVDLAASFYQTRSTDGATSVAAVNGDGYDHLLSKTIGSGNFDICINSPFEGYYTNMSDLDWLKQVVANMLNCPGGPISVEETSWGRIKASYR